MALVTARTANAPETVKALVGEKIVGVIADYNGAWWLVVESGHAFVFAAPGNGGSAVYWTESPEAVKRLVGRRKKDLGAWMKATQELMAIEAITQP